MDRKGADVMANKYRVDVVNSRIVPCGMNSIRYIGDNFTQAKQTFDNLPTGRDAWNQENATYGVILSVWNESNQTYIVKCEKGLK